MKPKCVAVDLLEFDGAVRSAEPPRLAEAATRFAPDLMSEFSFDEPEFDEWTHMTREECREKALRAGATYLSSLG
jgi:hypothetical protein